jgi:hypothetical protein
VVADLDCAFDPPVDSEILGAGDSALDDNALSDPGCGAPVIDLGSRRR